MFDILEIGTTLSKRFAVVVLLALSVGVLSHPQETTNLLYGQSVQVGIDRFGNLGRNMFNVECTVNQDGWFGPVDVQCPQIQESTPGG